MTPPVVSIPGVEVLDELGRGAHSVVYRVTRAGRQYAVKLPLFDEAGEEADALPRRFLREAVALARVRHPALPAVMEVGRVGRCPYIIMELAAGRTLAERLRSGPLDESQVLELAVQLTDALVMIHDSGLVHRDIKPANVVFDPHTTAVRLVDFGFAALAANAGAEDGARTRHQVSFGTPEADLLSLGCVLFHCLTGVAPFVGSDPAPLLERHVASELHPKISRPLARILRRLLGLEEAPYPNATSLLHALEQYREHPSDAVGRARPRDAQPRGPRFLLGRDRELDRLRAAWRASAAGRGQVVFVRGGAGAGKSHLIRAFAVEMERGKQRCISVRCESAQHQPFGAARRLVEAHLDEYDRLTPARRLQALANLRTLAGDAASMLRALSPRLATLFRDALTFSRPEGAEQIFAESLAEFLGRLLNDAAPTTVIIDDVQWLDPGSRSVLGRLTDRASSRTLFVLAGRDDPESWPIVERLARSLDPERVWELPLEPLSEDQIGELIRAYLCYGGVDRDLIRHVARLSDGTPLSVLEILRSLLDAGALVPYWEAWRFDDELAARFSLPRGSVALLARRIAELESTTIEVLLAAAISGMEFDIELVSQVVGRTTEQTALALVDAQRAMLVESASRAAHRFVHDSVREALLGRAGKTELRSLHQRMAEALDRKLLAKPAIDGAHSSPASELGDEHFAPPSIDTEDDEHSLYAELTYATASHYADGEWNRDPRRMLATCEAAAKLAFRSFDNELALRFFGAAEQASAVLGSNLGTDVQLLWAEAQLRLGALQPGLSRLRALPATPEQPPLRAFVLSRIAWAEMQLDTDRAWTALREAFLALDVCPPSDSPISVVRSLLAWTRWALLPVRTARPAERRRLEVLSTLYYQAGRLAVETGRLGWIVQTTLRSLAPAERLGTSAALSRSYLMYSFVLTALGLSRRGRHYLAAGQRVAEATRNPTVVAHALQVRSAVSAWAGDVREALSIGARSLDEYGHWRELSEFCLTAYNQQQIETVRGRNLDAWRWLERSIAKLGKHEGPPMALEFLELSVRASLTALGREYESELLLSRLANITTRPPARGAVLIKSYGARAAMFTESANLNEDFEALVREVDAAHFNPRRVHLEVVEYYVHVAHARVHACLRVDDDELPARLAALRSALSDLKAAARIPLLRAHAIVIDAYDKFFSGHTERAIGLFSRAEALAQEEGAPWVLYAVHRGRAHMLRAAAIAEAARDQARLAEAIAREHGSAYRLRWIREEFSLGARQLTGSSEHGSGSPSLVYSPSGSEPPGPRPRRRGYLKSLVRLGQQTARELDPRQQGRQVLDELVEALRAERGFLFLTRDWLVEDTTLETPRTSTRPPAEGNGHAAGPDLADGALVLVAARDAAGLELEGARDYDTRLVEDISVVETVDSGDDGPAPNRGIAASHGDRAVVVTPLVVRGYRVGVVYLDRPLRTGVFSQNDARALSGLADQVPLVFELGRSLRAREQQKETQRGAEKLEAVGRLAGGIAHDFNNMLSVILTASGQILSQSEGSRRLTEDVETIQSAAERARDLTRQLLAFSRGQYLNPEVLRLNETVSRLAPIFRRLLGERVTLDLALDANLCLVKADPAQIDQVLTNLIVNAGDAMPRGGRIRIATRNVTVGKPEATEQLPRGRYAQIILSDTGEGMDEATRARAFEPFFTTKAARSGSGLGLATAYGIIRQSAGYVELESKLGSGTTFRIYLPDTGPKTPTASVPPPDPAPRGNETILLVDDEPLVRASTHRILRALGYTVLAAGNSDEALSIARQRISGIDLVVTDVIMPGMNGLELARELSRLRPSVKVLFMSGYTDGVLAERGVLRDSVAFVQKPVTREKLAQRMRSLLDAGRR